MNLGIVGCGPVGLTTGICLASIGHKISLFDTHKAKLEKVREKQLPFFEPGLEELLEENSKEDKIFVRESIKNLVEETDGCFICVGTPSKENDSIDLRQVENSIKEISGVIKQLQKKDYLIIIRSTIIPSTINNIILPILNQNLDRDNFQLAIVPEFLREGKALDDFMNPDKIVIGSNSKKTAEKIREIFDFFKNKCDFIITNFETAEMIKYVNNSFFAMLISFSNEIANLSEEIKHVDAFEVLKALVLDKRITFRENGKKIIPGISEYLAPGCGFGGSCFPKDVKAITNYAQTLGTKTPILNAILEINNKRAERIVSQAEEILKNLRNKKICILGLSFKPETDDIRSSPSITVISLLLEKGAKISAYDPKVTEESLKMTDIKSVEVHRKIEDGLFDSDLAILLTKWEEFSHIDERFLKQKMKSPIIIDTRGFLDGSKFKPGTYFKIGLAKE